MEFTLITKQEKIMNKNKNELLTSKLSEIVELLDTDSLDPRIESWLESLVGKKLRILVPVYKKNIETKEFIPVGEINLKTNTVTLIPDPAGQFKCITRLENAKPYSYEWFIKDNKEQYKYVEPSNQINEVWLYVGTKNACVIGVIDDFLKVTLYSSYQMRSDHDSRQQNDFIKSYKKKK